MRQFANGEVEVHLVDRDVEVGPEGQRVLRNQRGLLLVEQRNADITARHHLGRQLPDDLAELHGEQRTADVLHEFRGVAEHPAHLFRRLVTQYICQRVRNGCRHRLRELLPHRHGRRHPLGAAHEARLGTEAGHVGGLVEPERRDVEGLLERRPLGGQGDDGGAAGDGLRLFEREAPVDAFAARLERALQLLHEARDQLGVVREPCGARQLRRVDVGVA